MSKRSFIFFSSLIVVLLCSHHLTKAQSYLPIPDSNATWKIEFTFSDGGCFMQRAFIDSVGGDTIIGSINYSKINRTRCKICSGSNCGFCPNMGYRGAIRSDTITGKVYYVPVSSSSDTLLYDFGLKVGDTVKGYLPQGGDTLTVWQVDTVVLGGISRKRLLIDPYAIYLIEGIGSGFGIVESFSVASLIGLQLSCFMSNGVSVYSDPMTCAAQFDCNQLVGISSKESSTNNFTLFPNPGTNKIQLKGDFNFPLQLQMYSLNGQVILNSEMKKGKESIDTSKLPRGMYFIRVEDAEGKFGFGKWIKE